MDGEWSKVSGTDPTKDIWLLKIGSRVDVTVTRGPLKGSGVYGQFWQGKLGAECIAHGDLEKTKAKIEWLIWRDYGELMSGLDRIGERVKSPSFKYDGSW